MLDNRGFDLWADGYDQSVGLSDEDGTYPFAGYKQILNEIYNRVLTGKGKKVLDIGFGTGTLTAKLYEQGCDIWGQDFSERMIELAKQKMPKAKLYQGDVAFATRAELERCRTLIGNEWDDEEIYFAVDELIKSFPQMDFAQFSFCAGLLSLKK